MTVQPEPSTQRQEEPRATVRSVPAPGIPGAFTAMQKKTLIIHSLWALTASGAWWIGTHQGESGPATERENRIRLSAAASLSRDSAIHADGAVQPVLDKQDETSAWVRSWCGADGRISPEQMNAAVKAALADPDSVRALRHFTHLLTCLSGDNALAAMQLLRSHASPAAASWFLLLAAAQGARGAPFSPLLDDNEPARDAAFAAWTSAHPGDARAWFEAQAKTGLDSKELAKLDALRSSLVRGLARNDPAAAVAFLGGLSEGERGDLVRVIAEEQLRRGAPAAAQWAQGLTDESLRGGALEAIARRYMQVDPGAGATWAAQISEAPDTRQAVARVADRMAEKDVRAAFAWTLQLPASPGQEEAFQQVFSEWARQDPGASSEELRSMTPRRERDNAIHSFSRILVNESPGDAIIWATAISDPALRLDTQIDVARTWNETAPAEAQPWIASHLPADAQARALAKE